MALKIYSTIEPDGTFPAVKAKDVEMPDGTRLSKFAGGGGSAEIPIFDLAALGMTAIPLTGGNAALETDTTELFEALNKGAVTFGLPVVMDGATITGYCTMHSFTDGATMHQCVGTFISDYPVYLMVVVQEGAVIAAAFPLSAFTEGTPPVSIDLTAFESNGTIVENFANGSPKTTTIEFDADGNPVKVTDNDGNVTVLTW